jgi:hypothetical protein
VKQRRGAIGEEFIALLRSHPLPSIPGTEGATFCIYLRQVNDDGDGPLGWCRPVPNDLASALAWELPELTLRTEPPIGRPWSSLVHTAR